MPHANWEARRRGALESLSIGDAGVIPTNPREMCPRSARPAPWKRRANGAKLAPPMGHLTSFGAFFALLACAACSASSDAVDFDHGSGSTAGDSFGSGQARLSYPAPPYGAAVGATVDNYRFLGWANPATAKYDTNQLSEIQLAQFYDPDGKNGVKYLVITSTAVWCSACKLEYQDMASGQTDKYTAKGVRFLGALFQNNNESNPSPASPSDLSRWAQTFSVTFNFVLDPEFRFGNFFDREATPMEMIVDAKTMQVEDISTGWATSGPGSTWSKLDQLLGL